jgi:hypothetical protein
MKRPGRPKPTAFTQPKRAPKFTPLFSDEGELQEMIEQLQYEADNAGAIAAPCSLFPWLERELRRLLVESNFPSFMFDVTKASDLSLALSAEGSGMRLNNLQRPITEALLRIAVSDGEIDQDTAQFLAWRLTRIHAVLGDVYTAEKLRRQEAERKADRDGKKDAKRNSLTMEALMKACVETDPVTGDTKRVPINEMAKGLGISLSELSRRVKDFGGMKAIRSKVRKLRAARPYNPAFPRDA